MDFFRSQIRASLKKTSFEDAGMTVRGMTVQSLSHQPQQGMLTKSSQEVTLNMLNATENEVDVEGLHDVKVEFDGAMEEVTS